MSFREKEVIAYEYSKIQKTSAHYCLGYFANHNCVDLEDFRECNDGKRRASLQ